MLIGIGTADRQIRSQSNITQATPIKVLFVCSGNSKRFNIAPFIKSQGDSLDKEGVEVDYFTIKGKGILGYLKNIEPLRQYHKAKRFDLIHVHFTLSAWVVVLARLRSPIVLSLMGTDALGRINKGRKSIKGKYLAILTTLIQPFVNVIISKSSNVGKYVWFKRKSLILPNGVDLNKFDGRRINFKEELGMDLHKKHILFLGNPDDYNKNFQLLGSIRAKLRKRGMEIWNPYPVPHELIVKYLSSADLLVMCSFQEGSPNIVKEAMASNCKGVFTDVGDVRQLIEDTAGYAISKWEPVDLERAILEVDAMESCSGRKRIKELGLDSETVAKKLKLIYQQELYRLYSM